MGKVEVKKIGIFYKDDPYLVEVARELESFLKKRRLKFLKTEILKN